MLSKNIIAILCVILLVKGTSVAGQCPFLNRNRPTGQPEDRQNEGDDNCKFAPRNKCDVNDVFYSIDGSCNNFPFPGWGKVGTPFVRLLPGNYSDGYSQLRRSVVDGSDLPLPRTLSVKLFRDQNIPSNRLNIWFYGFGQFVDHDVTLSDEIKEIKAEECCDNNKPAKNHSQHCLPIIIPKDDDFYKKFDVTCVPLRRTVHTMYLNCTKVAHIFQINSQTAFLDLSILYGANNNSMMNQRSGIGGKLKVQNNERTNNQEFPPILPAKECKLNLGGVQRGPGKECFMSGDERTNQNPEILLTDIIFLRLHNHIAKSLHSINPGWNDKKLFEEARRICIAVYQHVVYAEYLPVLLGTHLTSLYKLIPATSGQLNEYDVKVNPQTLASYSAAAARAGHSNIVGSFNYTGPNGKPESYRLRGLYNNNEFLLRKNMLNIMLQEYLGQTCSEQDQFTTEEVNNWTFFNIDRKFGLDLTAADIIRGRDFGLPPYNKFREACGLCPLKSFEDFKNDTMRPEDVEILKSLYKSVDDIDFFVGGQLEKPLPGGTLGPSFACIQAESFFRWKFGDRLYYEFTTAKFPTSHLEEIRKTTMSGILCLTNPSIKSIQKNSFLVESSQNPRIQCKDIPTINLNPWKETKAIRKRRNTCIGGKYRCIGSQNQGVPR